MNSKPAALLDGRAQHRNTGRFVFVLLRLFFFCVSWYPTFPREKSQERLRSIPMEKKTRESGQDMGVLM